jgi:hypothetical protein
MGTQPTTQSSWQYSNRRRAGSRPASPIVTDCAAIDQIINVVHQPAKLTFHRHRALLQRIYDLLKREQTGNKAQSSLKAAHSGDIGNTADMAPNGQPLRLPTTSQLPKGCTGETIPRGRTA